MLRPSQLAVVSGQWSVEDAERCWWLCLLGKRWSTEIHTLWRRSKQLPVPLTTDTENWQLTGPGTDTDTGNCPRPSLQRLCALRFRQFRLGGCLFRRVAQQF